MGFGSRDAGTPVKYLVWARIHPVSSKTRYINPRLIRDKRSKNSTLVKSRDYYHHPALPYVEFCSPKRTCAFLISNYV